MYGEKHMVNSCEVYRRSGGRRSIVYGRTREEVLEAYGESDFDDLVVTKTRVIQSGLSSQWVRGTRGFDDYGQPLTG